MKAQPPTAAAAQATWRRRRSRVASASRTRRNPIGTTLSRSAWGSLGGRLGSTQTWSPPASRVIRLGEGDERAVHALHPCHARPPRGGGRELRAAGRAELAVADHAERLAEPAVAADGHRAVERLVAVLDQLDGQLGREVDEVLDLGAADAGVDVLGVLQLR